MKRDRFLDKVYEDALKMLKEFFTGYDFNKVYSILDTEINSDVEDRFTKDRDTVVLNVNGEPLFYVSILSSGQKEFRPYGLKLVDRDNFVSIHLEFDENFEHICFATNLRGARNYLNIYNINTIESKGVTIVKINDIVNMMEILIEGVEEKYPEIKR